MITALRLTLALLASLLVSPAWATFTVHADGTVTDTDTGLMWDKCSWGQSGTFCSGIASGHVWSAALGVAVSANGARHKGYADWRLPNRTELESLVKLDRGNPAIDGTVFLDTPSSYFWTSTTVASDSANAWVVYFYNGNSGADNKTLISHVRLVRGGQSFGSFDSMATSVATPAVLTASLTPSATSGVAPLGLSFAASGSSTVGSDALSYAWNFGDGTTGQGPNASHTYTAAGSYTVTLTVSNTTGQSATATQTVTVTAVSVITAGFTADVSSGTAPLTVHFGNTSRSSSSTDVLDYCWTFGDLGPAVCTPDANPSHAYTTAGSYTVTLTTRNSTGQSASATRSITVAHPVQTAIPVTGHARLRPQLIMGGFDPILIDLNDSSFKLMAVVRPGAVAIQSVQTRSNAGGFSQAMTYAGTFDNGDQLYETIFTFPRGVFPADTLLGDLFGSATSQFRMSVTDTAQQTHAFPDMEFGNHVALTGSTTSPASPTTSLRGAQRYSPQVLAAGFDPPLIDLVDDSFDVVAIVRQGSNPIRRVGITQNQSSFAMAMTLDATLPNGDTRYKMTYLYVRGAFPAMRASDIFGTLPGQLNIMVADESGDIQHFPNLRWGSYPAR